jgi:hypothetical protein
MSWEFTSTESKKKVLRVNSAESRHLVDLDQMTALYWRGDEMNIILSTGETLHFQVTDPDDFLDAYLKYN